MISVRTAIETRRSVKDFAPDFVIPKADEETLLGQALMSPTAFNIQHWRFVVIRDPELRRRLRAVANDQPQITDAALLIAVCADTNAWRRDLADCWSNVDDDLRETIAIMVDGFYRGRTQFQRDEALRSCGIAAQTLMLAATGMGYGSCAMDLLDADAVGRLISLPDDHVFGMFVAIGKARTPPKPRPGARRREEVVLVDRFTAPVG